MGSVFKQIFILLTALCAPWVNALTYTEEQVLQAIFISFQPIDVFNGVEIVNSREIIFVAAAEGNEDAIHVLNNLKSFVDFYGRPPKRAEEPVVKQIMRKVPGAEEVLNRLKR